jgi:hypothetical protein
MVLTILALIRLGSVKAGIRNQPPKLQNIPLIIHAGVTQKDLGQGFPTFFEWQHT